MVQLGDIPERRRDLSSWSCIDGLLPCLALLGGGEPGERAELTFGDVYRGTQIILNVNRLIETMNISGDECLNLIALQSARDTIETASKAFR